VAQGKRVTRAERRTVVVEQLVEDVELTLTLEEAQALRDLLGWLPIIDMSGADMFKHRLYKVFSALEMGANLKCTMPMTQVMSLARELVR